MSESAKFLGSFKLFYKDHFVACKSRDSKEFRLDAENSDDSSENSSDDYQIIMFRPMRVESLDFRKNIRLRLRELLFSYISSDIGLNISEDQEAVKEDTAITYDGAKKSCGGDWQNFRSFLSSRGRSMEPRGDFYVSVEFTSINAETEINSEIPWYGRVLNFMEQACTIEQNQGEFLFI